MKPHKNDAGGFVSLGLAARRYSLFGCGTVVEELTARRAKPSLLQWSQVQPVPLSSGLQRMSLESCTWLRSRAVRGNIDYSDMELSSVPTTLQPSRTSSSQPPKTISI